MKVSPTLAVATAMLAVGTLVGPLQAGTSKSRIAGTAAAAPVLTPNLETIYEAVQPCRAFDTRASNGGGALAANHGRAFFVAGSSGFDAQGGPANGCGIPISATAVTLSLTSSGSTANGMVTAFPFGSAFPHTTALSFSPSSNATAGVTVEIAAGRVALRATGGSTQVAGDVTGYFAPQIQVYVNSDGSIFSYSPRIVSATRTSAGTYAIKIDRDVVYCAGTASPIDDGVIATANTLEQNTVYVATLKLSNGAFVRMDAGFNLVVHC